MIKYIVTINTGFDELRENECESLYLDLMYDTEDEAKARVEVLKDAWKKKIQEERMSVYPCGALCFQGKECPHDECVSDDDDIHDKCFYDSHFFNVSYFEYDTSKIDETPNITRYFYQAPKRPQTMTTANMENWYHACKIAEANCYPTFFGYLPGEDH